ncbi:MAG: hypothetical protein HQL38_07440 [Alphaproteobacteria bacterium]|nr:hypothetical protein [Alphaproteobacteria bacterium]
MTIELPRTAFFLARPGGENKGVDFLGLRQTNLAMMAEAIPSTNNVTNHIAPFTLLCWIFWKFHALCVQRGIHEPDSRLMTSFRERVEILFTWGARLADWPGIPGKLAEPPQGSPGVPLTFKAWKRITTSTSLAAALWYGPASKTVTGLGFLMPVPGKGGFLRTVGRGIDLAKGLDVRLQGDWPRYDHLLATLDEVTAHEDDARALWSLWGPDVVGPAERDAFQSALFSEEAVGDYKTLIGKRSSTLALARLYLANGPAPRSPDDIRRGMFLCRCDEGPAYALPATLGPAHRTWVVLQVRQVQRLALESLLSWCERHVLGGLSQTDELADRFVAELRSSGLPLAEISDIKDALAPLAAQAANLEAYLDGCRQGSIPTPFALTEAILEQSDSSAGLAAACLHALSVCASFAGCLSADTPEIRLGGAARLSLYHLSQRFFALADAPIVEAARYLLEALVISQHFATAVNRFDGQNQRLRLAIEETGLSHLIGEAWHPTVTADRLATILSLAAECGLVAQVPEGYLLNSSGFKAGK